MARQERTTDPLAGITAARRKRFKPLLQTWAAFKDVPAEEVEREVSIAMTEDRAERRAKATGSAGEARGVARPDRVATAGAYVLVDGFVAFMVGVAHATGDRLVVIRLGGHREAHETAWDCAAREVLEEASLVVHPLPPPATYWVDPDQDQELPRAALWQRPPGEGTDPLLVAARHEAGERLLSVTYFAGAQGIPVPAHEAQGLLLLRRKEILGLVRGSVTLDEFLRSGGRAVLRGDLPTNLPLEPFLRRPPASSMTGALNDQTKTRTRRHEVRRNRKPPALHARRDCGDESATGEA